MKKLKRYEVTLEIPTAMWGMVEVEAANMKEARAKALALNEQGEVSYEYGSDSNGRNAIVGDVLEMPQ